MREVFVSVRGRVAINVEALNMTESVGNYVKHRRVPVIVPETYVTYFVPAVSGESIAHGFQRVLADEAKNNGVKVCKLCSEGIFLKSTNENVFREAFGADPPEDAFEFERTVISNCLVEDVGGFLYAPTRGGNVKRTSNFYTGYMIPVKESLKGIVIEPQMHSRYALGTKFVGRGEREAIGQMIYYVELSSALYTFSIDLDTSYIGKSSFVYERAGEIVVGDRRKRIKIALDALQKFLIEFMFGAKRTRFLPIVEWESLAIAVSDDVWTVPSPFSNNYIKRAEGKMSKVNYNTNLYVYPRDGDFEEVIVRAIEDAKGRLGG